MGRTAFTKVILRSIRGSLGRFLAILGIVALGCGFYAGLQMVGPDMRAAADKLYDGTNLYDIRLVSTMGFTEKDIARVEDIEGVDSVMPAVSFDAMVRLGKSSQVAVRMSSMDVNAAEQEEEQDANVILSDDGTYMNRVFLRDGKWPQDEDECVISADKIVGDLKIGDTIEVLYGQTSLDDVLKTRKFTIVGTVSSSSYPNSGSFGSTTLGSGMIEQYIYVNPNAFVEDYPFTEMYLRVEGADAYESGSDEYKAAVKEVTDRIEEQKDQLSKARLFEVRRKAREGLDDARTEYEKQKADVQKQLDDAKVQLDAAGDELATNEQKLASGQAEYESGVAQLNASRAELANARATLDANRVELQNARAEYNSNLAAWESNESAVLASLGISGSLSDARAYIESQRQEILSARAALESGIAQAEAGIAQAQAAISQLEAGIAQLDAMIAALEDGPEKEALVAQRAVFAAQLDQVYSSLANAQATRDELEAQLASLPTTDSLDQASGAISQLESSKAALDSAAAQIASGEAQLAQGEAQYEAGQQQLASGQAQLESTAAQLASARSQLASGRAEYESKVAEYEQGKKEADQELADAEQQIKDAEKEIDELEAPDIYVLDRTKNEGIVSHISDSERMDSISNVFPLIFFLVAALVALTTMTRMVDDDRIEIGTYKALGYSTSRIASKYLIYAGIASVVGATLGILVLSQLLPVVVTSAYSTMYTVPIQYTMLPIDLGTALLAGGLGIGITLLSTYAAVVASLRESPAVLMLPRAPVAGKRILLEHVGFIWSNLSFSWKVTCRNMFRYKKRLIMTIVGIAGCTALMMVGFVLRDSIWDIIYNQHGTDAHPEKAIQHYNSTVQLNDDALEFDVKEVVDYLESTGEVDNIIRSQNINMQASSDDENSDPIGVKVYVPRSSAELSNAVTLQDRLTKEPITFDDDSVVISEKLATSLGLHVGDDIRIYEQDIIGNAVGDGTPVTITGITENYLFNRVYIGRKAWKAIDEKAPVFSNIWFVVNEDEEIRSSVFDELHEFDKVSTVSYAGETIALYKKIFSVLDMITVVLIVSAGLLAFIVLYNLTNINIGERIREIASLKVLGFTKGEVYAYIYREIVLLSIIGAVVGLVLGIFLSGYVVQTAEVDQVMFGRDIHVTSYIYSFVLTLVFTALILVFMRHKLDNVDMVESLKSID